MSSRPTERLMQHAALIPATWIYKPITGEWTAFCAELQKINLQCMGGSRERQRRALPPSDAF
jgi:hypothetical protein